MIFPFLQKFTSPTAVESCSSEADDTNSSVYDGNILSPLRIKNILGSIDSGLGWKISRNFDNKKHYLMDNFTSSKKPSMPSTKLSVSSKKSLASDSLISTDDSSDGTNKPHATVTIAMLIKFDQNKADIDPYYFPDLAKVAHFLNENLAVTVTVEGYVTTATPSASIEIARSRLQNVVNYLVDNFGVSRSRFVLEDSSHSRLFVANVGDRGMPDHCRVKIILNYPPLVPFDRTSNA